MASKSSSHRRFVSESMMNKPVTELAGIGEHLGEVLTRRGISQAYMVLGHFLMLEMDEDKFKEWLMENCGAQAHQQQACYACLRDWCLQHL